MCAKVCPVHLDYEDPKYSRAAAEILRRHASYESEAEITSAVRDFLILTGLAKSEEIREERPPALGSRRAVDLAALDTFVEVKRRVSGGARGLEPNPDYVQQLDDYLAESQEAGKGVRTGILTDGKHWLLRWPNAGSVSLAYPYAFTLDSGERWVPLFEWLRDKALVSLEDLPPNRENIADHFGPNSPIYERDITALKGLYEEASTYETIRVKRQLWYDLLSTALGEIARTPQQMEDLFVRHTYLSAVVGVVVQASFGLDIHRIAENDPADLLQGREFRSATGLSGVLESDFFAWPTEVGGLPLLRAIARRVVRFDWSSAPPDVAAILYETVIPPDERRQLGEYYTPAWLARTMVRELVTDPLKQRVLDPACGSGTFITEAVAYFIEAADRAGLDPAEKLSKLLVSVAGVDVHPVAVHLARAAWTLAAKPALEATAKARIDTSVSIPVYLGDALQLRFRTGDMFAEHEVTIQVDDLEDGEETEQAHLPKQKKPIELVFPVSLVERADHFDSLMSDVAEYIVSGQDPVMALDDNHVTDACERDVLTRTIEDMKRLHGEGRDHIWAYYTRNLVRPVALARSKVDVIIGNPPWLNYNQTISTLRTELESQSRHLYGIWAGGRYATHQDVAGLFFARSVDLYLEDGGVIGMVMPHSALQAGQYSRWRTGDWHSNRYLRNLRVDFGYKPAWDLEKLEPNTFFPIAASVVFAERTGEVGDATPLAGQVDRWLGATGTSEVRRVNAEITDTSVAGESPYDEYSRQGASLVPRCLIFVTETENPAIIQAGRTVTVNPRRGPNDKEPWRSLDLTAITSQTIEAQHVFDVHLGETLVPYATLPPLKVVLPVKSGDGEIPLTRKGVGGVRIGALGRRMRERWRAISRLWENNRAAANKMSLAERLDYHGELSSQLGWQQSPCGRPFRVLYTKSGVPTAALLRDDDALVDFNLYWVACKNV